MNKDISKSSLGGLHRSFQCPISISFFIFLVGAITAGFSILMAGYIKSPDIVIVCMCVAGFAAGIVYAGFQVNMLDIAPRNASVVMGITNATANTAGFLSPMLVGFITHNKVGFSNVHQTAAASTEYISFTNSYPSSSLDAVLNILANS